MSREWQVGDVAMVVNAYGVEQRALRGERRWVVPGDEWWDHHADPVQSARPLVVIDPEDREQVERLRVSLDRMSFSAWACGATSCLQAALHEFASPTPPKPEEPTGLGAVVEDAEGVRWIRVDWSNPWCRANPSNRQGGRTLHGSHLNWAQVDAVCVLSEGVQP